MSNAPELCKNTESISISVPSWILELVDGYCERTGMSRSGVFARGARLLLMILGFDKPSVWKLIYQNEKEESC